jgi:diacylglycerol O-acyltransferase / wax synthase
MGNRILAIRGPLPVFIADPLERLRYVSAEMADLKESKQALGAEVISGAQEFAPPTMLAQASRLNFSTRLFNMIVTNVPGPQFPLYLGGRELLQAYPTAFLPAGQALAIAIMSYSGQLNFGLLGDFDAIPDIDHIGDDIAVELAMLVALAKGAATTTLPKTPASTRNGAANGRRASSARSSRNGTGSRPRSARNGRRTTAAAPRTNGRPTESPTRSGPSAT